MDQKSKMDIFEAELAKHPQVHLPLIHRFTPGMYIREIFMPSGTVLTSMRHKTRHPFVVLEGVAEVIDEQGRSEILTAGHLGVTDPGTRRVIRIHADCRWATFHVTENTDPDEIADEITENTNPLLAKDFVPICFEKRNLITS